MTPLPCFEYDTLASNFLCESLEAISGKMYIHTYIDFIFSFQIKNYKKNMPMDSIC